MTEFYPSTDTAPRRKQMPLIRKAIHGLTTVALALGLSGDRGPQSKQTIISVTGSDVTWYKDGEGPKVVLPAPDQYRLLDKQPFTEQSIPSVMNLFHQAMTDSRTTGKYVIVEHWPDAHVGGSLTFGYVSEFRGKPAGYTIFGHAQSNISNSDFFRALGADPGQVVLLKAAWLPKRDGHTLLLVGSGPLVGDFTRMPCTDQPCKLSSALDPAFRDQLGGMVDMYEYEIIPPSP